MIGILDCTNIIANLVEDLINALYEPQYPICDYFSDYLCRMLLMFVGQTTMDNPIKTYCLNNLRLLSAHELKLWKQVTHVKSVFPGRLIESIERSSEFSSEAKKLIAKNCVIDRYGTGCVKYKELNDEKSFSVSDARELLKKIRTERLVDEYICRMLEIFANEQSSNREVKLGIIRCLEHFVRIDGNLLDFHASKKLIILAFESSLCSVREAAVDPLLAGLHTCDKRLWKKYWPLLINHLLDQSTSIRRNVTAIVNDLLKRNEQVCKKHCNELEFMFEFPNDVLARLIERRSELSDRHKNDSLTRIILAILKGSWLVKSGTKETIVEKTLKNMCTVIGFIDQSRLSSFIQLFDILRKQQVRAFENSSTILIHTAFQRVLINKNLTSDQILSYLWLIDVLSSYYPQSITSFIRPLINYLGELESNGTVAPESINQVLYLLLSILRRILLHEKKHLDNVLNVLCKEQLVHNIVPLIMTQSIAVIDRSIECLSIVNAQNQKAFVFLQNIFNVIKNCRDRPEDVQEGPKCCLLVRSICVIGLVFKYFENAQTLFKDDVQKTYETLSSFVQEPKYQILTRTRSIQAIGFLVLRLENLFKLRPFVRSLYTSILNVAEGKDGSEKGIQLMKQQIFENTRAALTTFASHDFKDNFTEITNVKEVDGAYTQSNYSLVAFNLIEQQQLSTSYVTSNNDLRCSVVKLLSAVTRQGLVHPEQYLSVLIASTTESNTSTSSEAQLAVELIARRYSVNWLMAAVAKAILLTVDIRKLLSDSDESVIGDFSPMFNLIKGNYRSHLMRFINIFVNIICSPYAGDGCDSSEKSRSIKESSIILKLLIVENLIDFAYDKSSQELMNVVLQLKDHLSTISIDIMTRINNQLNTSAGVEETVLVNFIAPHTTSIMADALRTVQNIENVQNLLEDCVHACLILELKNTICEKYSINEKQLRLSTGSSSTTAKTSNKQIQQTEAGACCAQQYEKSSFNAFRDTSTDFMICCFKKLRHTVSTMLDAEDSVCY